MNRLQKIGLSLALLAFPGAGSAAPILDSWNARFEAPQQSLWQPGTGTGVSWEGTLPLSFGPFSLNMGVNVTASSGTVFGNLEGVFGVSYDDYLAAPGDAHVQVNFGGLTNESNLTTALGGSWAISAGYAVDFPWPIPDFSHTLSATQSLELKSHTDFTYQEDLWTHDRATYEAKIAGLGIDVGIAGVEIAPQLYQNVHFKPGEVTGRLVYTHLGSGTSGSVAFSTCDPTWVGMYLPLNLPGYWALTVENLNLAHNSFYTEIGYAGYATAWATILGSVKWQEDYDIYQGGEFGLTFNEIDRLSGSMLVYVDEGHTIPEPTTIALIASGMLALFWVRGRRSPPV